MKLSQLVANYVSKPKQKAKLLKRIKLNNGTVFKKGTVSDLLIEREPGVYHFEAQNMACTVTKDEIEFI